MSTSLGASNPFHLVGGQGPFQAIDLVTQARFDPVFFVLVAAVGTWYFRTVRRATRAGDGSFALSSSAFGAGLLVVVAATMSGLATNATTNVTIHMIDDAMLLLIAPALLALGKPLRLVAAAGGRRSRVLSARVVAGRAARALTHPLVAWVLMTAVLISLYFGGLYQLTIDNRGVADLANVVLLAVGLIFAWPAVGGEPLARPSSFPQRMATVFMGLPAFTLLGMALDSQRSPIAPGLGVDDLHRGGDVLWGLGSLLGIGATIAVLVSGIRAEMRSSVGPDQPDPEGDSQLALWRANRAAAAMEDALAASTVVKVRPGADSPSV